MQTSPAIVANIINPSIFTVTPVTRKRSSAIENNQRAYLCLETFCQTLNITLWHQILLINGRENPHVNTLCHI